MGEFETVFDHSGKNRLMHSCFCNLFLIFGSHETSDKNDACMNFMIESLFFIFRETNGRNPIRADTIVNLNGAPYFNYSFHGKPVRSLTGIPCSMVTFLNDFQING